MKTVLLLFLVILNGSLFAQEIEYRDKAIYLEDSAIYKVIEIKSGRQLEEKDYFKSDSSQYYDYMIVTADDGTPVLYLSLIKTKSRSNTHFPNRYVRHEISLRNNLMVMNCGVITEDNLSILAGNENYRNYLIDYLIDSGLLDANGINKAVVDDFRENHRR